MRMGLAIARQTRIPRVTRARWERPPANTPSRSSVFVNLAARLTSNAFRPRARGYPAPLGQKSGTNRRLLAGRSSSTLAAGFADAVAAAIGLNEAAVGGELRELGFAQDSRQE